MMIKKIIFMTIFLSQNLSAACCTVHDLAVVKATIELIKELKDYNVELGRSLDHSRSVVQLKMASAVEKERQLEALQIIKKTMGLKVDAKAVVTQQVLLSTTSNIGSETIGAGETNLKEITSIERK